MARTTTLNNQSQHLSLYQRSNEAETPTFLHPFLPSHSQMPPPEEPFKNLSHRLSFDEFSIKRTCEYFMIAAFHSRAVLLVRRSCTKERKKRHQEKQLMERKTSSFVVLVVQWVPHKDGSGRLNHFRWFRYSSPVRFVCLGPGST